MGEHRLLIGFFSSNLTRLKLKIMSIRLFCYKVTQMWRKLPKSLTKPEEEPFWRLWPVRSLECNVPTDCERNLGSAGDRCVCALLSHQQAVAATDFDC